MTDKPSIKITATYLEKENVLNFEIYFKNKLVVNEQAFYIDIPTLKKGILNDIDFESKKPILVTGCGHFGCCPGLFWKLVHENEFIIISDVYWWDERKYYLPIEGHFRLLL
ncbi:MAG: hypothetical protein ACFFDF_19750, partial [Candidatus Odinarchaeota archaeon]